MQQHHEGARGREPGGESQGERAMEREHLFTGGTEAHDPAVIVLDTWPTQSLNVTQNVDSLTKNRVQRRMDLTAKVYTVHTASNAVAALMCKLLV